MSHVFSAGLTDSVSTSGAGRTHFEGIPGRGICLSLFTHSPLFIFYTYCSCNSGLDAWLLTRRKTGRIA